jgi:S1-C subfamily serine protease
VAQDKISVSAEDIAGVSLPPPSQMPDPPSLGAAIPLIARITLALAALVLPILCVLAAAIRIYIRNKEPRVQHSWTRYLCSLLIASGTLTTAIFVCALLWLRLPLAPLSSDSHVLDTISAFPDIREFKTHTVEDLAKSFRKTVVIVTQQPKWNRLSRESLPAVGFGSGVLVFANHDGYLVLSSRHVIDGFNWQQERPFSGNIALAAEEGDFTSAKVAGRHRNLDLILLRVDRHSGNSNFVQPIVEYADISPGERIFVFGHPEGFFFSVSDGIVSRKDGASLIQITAPISPGASGGPVLDLQGRLLGIVKEMVDKQRVPQSENLNFAVRADTLLRSEDWTLDAEGARLMKEFLTASQDLRNNPRPSLPSPSNAPVATSTPTKPH